jgi:putative SOS response-associated peptidase YedK
MFRHCRQAPSQSISAKSKEKVDFSHQSFLAWVMCGRFALIQSPDILRSQFGYAEQPNMPPRYNIAPTQPVAVVRMENGARQFTLMRWGFIPEWVKDEKAFPLVINVRSETARVKPSFRNALHRRRCLMPVDGFYEWHRVGTGRQAENRPYLFRRPDHQPFAFAAIWECWNSADGSQIDTVALLNGPANGLMSAVHHRCPVILDPADWPLWLDTDADEGEIDTLLRPPPDDLLEMVRISSLVNKVANDGPEVQAAFVAEPVQPKAKAGPVQGSLF